MDWGQAHNPQRRCGPAPLHLTLIPPRANTKNPHWHAQNQVAGYACKQGGMINQVEMQLLMLTAAATHPRAARGATRSVHKARNRARNATAKTSRKRNRKTR